MNRQEPDDALETIELETRPVPRRPRMPAVVAIVLAGIVIVAAGAIALVTSEHHATRNTTPAPSPSTTSPAFSATMLGFTSGRFAVVDDGRLEFVDAHSRNVTPALAPAGRVAIAATNGPSLIVVALRHWYLVEPDREPVPVPDGNVFARHAGGWWLAQGPDIRVLGGIGTPVHVPAGTTPIADSGAGFVVQDNTSGHVELWNPSARTTKLRTVVAAPAEIVAAGGDKVAWRSARDDGTPVRIVDIPSGRSTTIASTGLTSGADASFAPDGKHIAFYARQPSGTVAVFDTTTSALLVKFNARALGVFSSVTSLPGPRTLQPVPFTWTTDGVKIVVLGSPYPLPRVTALDTNDGIAITTPVSIALDQVAALDTPSTS